MPILFFSSDLCSVIYKFLIITSWCIESKFMNYIQFHETTMKHRLLLVIELFCTECLLAICFLNSFINNLHGNEYKIFQCLNNL